MPSWPLGYQLASATRLIHNASLAITVSILLWVELVHQRRLASSRGRVRGRCSTVSGGVSTNSGAWRVVVSACVCDAANASSVRLVAANTADTAASEMGTLA